MTAARGLEGMSNFSVLFSTPYLPISLCERFDRSIEVPLMSIAHYTIKHSGENID